MVGGAGSEKEQILDLLLQYLQAQEGNMLGTIRHVSDGEVPQQIMAVIPGQEEERLESPLEQWVEGRWKVAPPKTDSKEDRPAETFLSRFLNLLAAVDKGHQDSEAQTGKPKIPGMTWLPKAPK
jgi:hypothetical protein